MRAVIQRVTHSAVSVDNKVIGEIGKGLNVLLGVGEGDTDKEMEYIAKKIVDMRIFEDENGKMNLDIKDVGGSILLISQFTLYGDCSHGRRPFFGTAMEPVGAKAMYEKMADCIRNMGVEVQMGEFGADMSVEISNDGPVTIILESK
ncbi:MAG: D-tyrosyl-tRNA(Tyr) deacylase [Clostridia bacterium]|nr:D-tyrosyl-tRNA(Tyr) deacylase [Clostridia bacterium]